jgi:uncharacterized protein (TIGR03435 family)
MASNRLLNRISSIRCIAAVALFSALALVPAWISVAQEPNSPSFEVATIKPSQPATAGPLIGISAGRITLTGFTLKELVVFAYWIHPSQVGGASGWMASDKFDIVGKPEKGFVPQDQLRKMVQNMLAERFQLSIRHDEKELPIYVLSEAKGGSKMKARKPNDGGAGFRLVFDGAARLPGRNATVAQLIFVLQTRGVFDRPVVDKTGFTGNFDFDLSWSPIENQPGGRGAAIASDSDAPDLFTAIQQQLGLKLESRRGPVDVVMIDRVEKPLTN